MAEWQTSAAGWHLTRRGRPARTVVVDARDFAAIALLLGFVVFVSYLRSRRLRLVRKMGRPVDRATHEAPDEELAEIIRRKERERS